MTILDILEVVFMALCEGVQIDRLMFEESLENYSILQENYPLTEYTRMAVQTLFSFSILCE
jgi:hypothetical protein